MRDLPRSKDMRHQEMHERPQLHQILKKSAKIRQQGEEGRSLTFCNGVPVNSNRRCVLKFNKVCHR
jgi:hypothetical protein